MKNQPLHTRMGFAFSGIHSAWRSENSFRAHCLATICVVALLGWRNPPLVWWALLLMNSGLVLAAELFNSALEALADHLHPARHPAIGLVKDCAAGAVLVLSISALGVFAAFMIDTFS